MNKENYLKTIIKELTCSKGKKLEIKRELESDIQTALASGELWQEIKERMGDPKEIAKEFNANQSYQEIASLKRKRRFKILGIVVLILICLITAINWALPKSGENRSVTYTISFDQDMKLAGLFMK
jgi:uncharacterized membrane protein